jgi:hypothetical protein
MATTYKVLGQLAPAVTTEVSFSAVPAATSWVVSTVAISNITGTPANITLNVCVGGAASGNTNTLLKTVSIPANTLVPLTLGLTLAATDIIRITAGTANALSVQLFGSEIA